MRTSQALQFIAIIGFVMGSYLTQSHDGTAKVIGYLLAGGSLVGFIWRGLSAKGWVGPPIEEIETHIRALEAAEKEEGVGAYSQLAPEKREALMRKYFRMRAEYFQEFPRPSEPQRKP